MEDLKKEILDFFGSEGLIIYAKANEYYRKKNISMKEIKEWYDYLNSKNVEPEISKTSHILCSIFFLTRSDETTYKNEFMTVFSDFINKNTGKDMNNLYIIYNIIDYDTLYEILEKKDKEKLKQKMEFLGNSDLLNKKRIGKFIYRYFHSLMLYNFEEYEKAHEESMLLKIDIDEFEVKKSISSKMLIDYMKTKNKLLPLHIFTKSSKAIEAGEAIAYLNDLFKELKYMEPLLSITIGLALYDKYLENEKIENCENTLTELIKILDQRFEDFQENKAISFTVAIASRKAFLLAIKKMDEFMEKSIYDLKEFIIKETLNNVSHFKEKISNILIETHIAMQTERIVDGCIKKICDNQNIPTYLFFSYIVGIYAKVSSNFRLYFLEKNEKIKVEHGKEIINLYEGLIKYLTSFGESEPLLKKQITKTIYIEITATLGHLYLYYGDYESIKKIVERFEENAKIIEINSDNPAYGKINKIKADCSFIYDKDKTNVLFNNIIENYNINKYQKAIILFNQAMNYISQGIIGDSKNLLEKAKNLLNELPENEKNSETVKQNLKIINELTEKIKNAE